MKVFLKRAGIVCAGILAIMFLFNIIQYSAKPVTNIIKFPGSDGVASVIGVIGVVQARDDVIVNTRTMINFFFLGLSTDLGYGIRVHVTVLPIVGHFLARSTIGEKWLLMLNNIGVGVGLLGGG